MEVISTPIADLKMDPANVRKHGPRNIETIVASLQKFGQQKPIVIDKNGVVVAGNGTLAAARQLGWSSIDAVRTGLEGSQATAFAIADNRTAELAEWDTDALAQTLAALQIEDEELARMTGFDDAAIKELIDDAAGATEVTEDDVPEPPDDPITKPGDLWVLGNHRLLCGDSTNADDVARLMVGNRAQCVFTDPPYGVSVADKNRLLNTFQKAGQCLEDIKDDTLSPEQLKARLVPAFVSLRMNIMADDCTLFVSAPQGGELMMMMMMMKEAGLAVRHVLIWKKNQPTFSLGRLDYDYQHEPILLTWGKRHKRPMNGTHKTSVWEIDRERKCDVHPTMKPVALYANAYLNNSDDGDSVADIYAGSGTAFIAAEQLNRRCYGMEISPSYCDVIVKRWEALTGGKAERQESATIDSPASHP